MLDASLLYGSWELTLWRHLDADSNETYPYTKRASGRLIYEPSNRLAVFLMHPGWATGEVSHGFISYSGHFVVSDGEVHHLVDMASQGSLVGQRLIRPVRLEEGSLQLLATAPNDSAGRHILEWRRT
jgi:hypothetical protein